MEEYLSILFQILFSLRLANKLFKYTHYDLHAGNVLIIKVVKDIVIPYEGPNGTIYNLKTKVIAYIFSYSIKWY